MVRTPDQRYWGVRGSVGDDYAAHVRDLKLRMERLRVPLAKMGAAKRHPTDNPIAYPAIDLELGIAWQVAKDTLISRHELPDALLELAGV